MAALLVHLWAVQKAFPRGLLMAGSLVGLMAVELADWKADQLVVQMADQKVRLLVGWSDLQKVHLSAHVLVDSSVALSAHQMAVL